MKQIENGAPANVFASADLDWMDYGARHKLIKDDTRVNLLGNRLVLIAPKDSKLDNVTIEPGFDLASSSATAVSSLAACAPCRSANTPRPRWRSSAHGSRSNRNSP
jgi:ABC-type molybdate transport system substrate-binding protein